MSFLKPKDIIEEGDTVILYISIHSIHSIQAMATIINKNGECVENIFQTSFGALKVRSIIGIAYGSKVQLSKGWAYVLQANPQLWTVTLPHRTQIIYTPDISMIIFQLELRPGSVVIESGTGSGSLSHHILRAIKPFGHLHTFDFHETRAVQAREEFQRHGLEKLVTVYHRDVCKFGFSEELNGKVDAVFLDLPAPNEAIVFALKALKSKGGRFCSFSPCIEQSQRCCITLEEQGFTQIQSMEILQNEDLIKTKMVPVIDLEFLKHKKLSTSDSECNSSSTENALSTKSEKGSINVTTSLTPMLARGHTGYLTVATLPPAFAR